MERLEGKLFFKKVGSLTMFLLSAFLFAQPELKFEYIKVKQGDTFWKLFKDKWEIVSRINKIDKWHLLPGVVLKVPIDWELAKKYPFFPEFLEQEKETPKLIIVVIQEQFLAGYEYGELKFWYPVCSGKEKGLTPEWFLKTEGEWPTPRGRFQALYKDKYHKSNLYPEPTGGWPMLYAVMFSWKGYGFHAFSIPKSLKEKFGELPEELEAEVKKSSRMPGWPSSHGCIRLFREDARELFKWARVGTVVLIIDSFEQLEQKASI